MSDVFGEKLKLTIFGESHGKAIGVVIDGLPAGVPIDMEAVRAEMERRAPGRHRTATARKELDRPEILSGFFEGKTTGTALCAMIQNADTRSQDYRNVAAFFRPGHADFPAFMKYNGFEDYRGGGHFSGRITAPLVFAGAVCKQILQTNGVRVYGRATEIGGVRDTGLHGLTTFDEASWKEARTRVIPTLSPSAAEKMEETIMEAFSMLDSVGGIVEVIALGLPVGLGAPFFDSVESRIAHLAFSVPAIKGIEFGEGFALANFKGSEANDAYYNEDGDVRTETNNNGGLLGGLTNGMPLVFRCVVKPTASISQEQKTVAREDFANAVLTVKGRHDPSIVPRVVPVLEAVCAVALLDYML